MLISIILPLNKNEDKKRLLRCLNGLNNQTYKKFEVIVITFPELDKKFSDVFRKYKFIKRYTGEWNKSESRNFGALKAKGKYLLHLDVDMKLTPGLIFELTNLAKQKKAVVIPCPIKKCDNYWSRCRKLEAKIFLNHQDLESPIFINSSLFKKIGGYDERIDPLDDWGLHLELKKRKIKFGRSKEKAELFVHSNLRTSFKRMFERGQAILVLKEKYPDLPQINIGNKINTYWKKREILLSQPIFTLGLLILKIVDYIAFILGKIYPKQAYFLKSVSSTYEEKRMNHNFTLYKHYVECLSLIPLLKSNHKIIEVGSGTGRITKELVNRGYKITPTDPSLNMLKEYYKKKNLPKATLAFGDNLPFKNKSFDCSLAIRVVWHFPQPKALSIVKEMTRVSTSYVIFDVVNKKRFFKFLISPNTYAVNLDEFIQTCTKEHSLQIEKIIPMDVSLHIWLNLFPKSLAKKCFPSLYKLDLAISKIIPAGRHLLKFRKE